MEYNYLLQNKKIYVIVKLKLNTTKKILNNK